MGYHYEQNVNEYIYDWDAFEASTGVRRYSLKDDEELSIETENSHMYEPHSKPPSAAPPPADKRPTFNKPELKAAMDNNYNDDCSHQDEKHDTVGELSDIRMQTQVYIKC